MLESQDVRMLADLGFIALFRGWDPPAAVIFEGVKAARPEQEAGHMGIALVHLFRGEADKAVSILRKLPPSDAVSTFLAIAIGRTGDTADARKRLREVVRTAPRTPFASLAHDALIALDQNGPRRATPN